MLYLLIQINGNDWNVFTLIQFSFPVKDSVIKGIVEEVGKSAFVKRGFAYSSGDHNNQYGLQSTGGRFEFSLGDGASGVVAMTSAGFAKTNTWYFVTGIIDSNNAYLYVNGVLQDTKIRPVGSPPVSDFMAIGTFNINQNYWRGIIDDARIYNRALSSKEVYSLYKLGQTVTDVSPTNKIGTGISSGLVGHWTFDGKDTNWTSSFVGTTKDSSGNNNTGNFSQMGRATSTIIGKIGQGLTFHGNDVINTTKPILSSTASNGFSTLVWLKDINSPIGSIVYELDGSTSLYLETGKTTGTRCVIRDDITSFFYTPYSTSNLDHKWHHYGCVLDRTTNVLTMYIDTASTSSVYVGGAGGLILLEIIWVIFI